MRAMRSRRRAESRFITRRGDVVNVVRTVTVVRGPDQRSAGGLVIVDPIAGS